LKINLGKKRKEIEVEARIPEVARSRRPQAVKIAEQFYIRVPVFDKDEKEKKLRRVIYVLEFAVTRKGPSRQAKIIYIYPGFGEPWPVVVKQARKQAYAVWYKKGRKYGKESKC
jgi:hypothetical protein